MSPRHFGRRALLAAPLLSTWNYALLPGSVRGTARALLWAHGKAGEQDQRAIPPPPIADMFVAAGYDLWRFARNPFADDTARAASWMRACLRALAGQGYRRIAVLGVSRGAWNALQMTATPGLAHAIIAISPAAQGLGAGQLTQLDALRDIAAAAPPSALRLAVVQFAGDAYDAGADARRALFLRWAPRLGGLLLIDRPAGFSGHAAEYAPGFAPRFGPELIRFAEA